MFFSLLLQLGYLWYQFRFESVRHELDKKFRDVEDTNPNPCSWVYQHVFPAICCSETYVSSLSLASTLQLNALKPWVLIVARPYRDLTKFPELVKVRIFKSMIYTTHPRSICFTPAPNHWRTDLVITAYCWSFQTYCCYDWPIQTLF